MKQPDPLILASSSPRRRELLTQAGFRFQVHPANIDEVRASDESPTAYVQRLALEKALAVLVQFPNATVLGADTTVELDHHILEKPACPEDAERMLRLLSGRTHLVHTAIAAVAASAQLTHVETTTVFFSEIPPDELAHYISTGDPFDKAGAYGIQGYAARWATRIEGDFFNVMGLPLAATARLLKNF
ncbi:MAG: Maf family protein [Acidobacteriota bacterium]